MNFQFQIKTKGEDLKGAYSNLMQILHTKEEFILDFFGLATERGFGFKSDYDPWTSKTNAQSASRECSKI